MADVISTVMPGERFTAVLMNQLVEALLTLDQRIAALEGRGSVVIPPSSPVAITQLVPGDEITVGQELRVFGASFGYTSGTIHVAVGATPITQFKAGSSDTALVFDVPGLVDGLPATLQVSVSNGATSAGRSINVKPATQLSGSVSLDFTLVDAPDETKTGSWRVRLTSHATQPATFTINASVSQSAWQSALKVFADASSATEITSVYLTPSQPKDVFVKLPIPSGADGTTFTLNVAVASGAAGGTSTSPTYTVGQSTGGTSSGVAYGIITASPSGRFDPTTRKVTLKPGQNVTLTINVALSFAGTYILQDAITADAPDGWSATPVLTPSSFTVAASEVSGTQTASRQLKYKITAYVVDTLGMLSSVAKFALPVAGGGGDDGGDGGGGDGGGTTIPVGGGPGTLEITLQRQSQTAQPQPGTLVIPFDNPPLID